MYNERPASLRSGKCPEYSGISVRFDRNLQHHQFRDKVLDEYEKDILEIYKKNEFKRLNMSSVYDFLEERYGKIPSTEKTLRNYIDYLESKTPVLM